MHGAAERELKGCELSEAEDPLAGYCITDNTIAILYSRCQVVFCDTRVMLSVVGIRSTSILRRRVSIIACTKQRHFTTLIQTIVSVVFLTLFSLISAIALIEKFA